jgi:hypothetical protein
MLPHIDTRIQVIRGLRVMLDVDLAALYGVANCDHLLYLTATQEPGSRLIGLLTHEKKKTPKACRLTKGGKAP